MLVAEGSVAQPRADRVAKPETANDFLSSRGSPRSEPRSSPRPAPAPRPGCGPPRPPCPGAGPATPDTSGPRPDTRQQPITVIFCLPAVHDCPDQTQTIRSADVPTKPLRLRRELGQLAAQPLELVVLRRAGLADVRLVLRPRCFYYVVFVYVCYFMLCVCCIFVARPEATSAAG